MIIGDEKLLSGKMVLMSLVAIKLVINALALFNSRFQPELIAGKIQPHAPFIYQSLENYVLYFSFDTLIILIGVIGYLLSHSYRWYFLAPALLLSLGLGLVLSGHY